MATARPSLGLVPDPFDKVVEAMLEHPEIRADLDTQHAQLKRGELNLHSHNDARAIVGLDPTPDGA